MASHTWTTPRISVPERLAAARLELVERHALLLDPGVVAQVEDALAVLAPALEHVGRVDGVEVGRPDLAGGGGVEGAAMVSGHDAPDLGAVHLGAVGGHREEHVARPQLLLASDLDGRQRRCRSRRSRTSRGPR